MHDFHIVSLRSLPEARRRDLLGKFEREIYRPAFPDDNQRQDPAVWLALLHADPGSPAPYLTILMAVNGFGYVGGALVLEHYRRAGVGLVTYVAVAPRYRGAGLARRLMDGALEVLAWTEGPKPIPLLAELDDPSRVPAEKKDIARAHILEALGMMKCDLPHVQPARAKGGERRSQMVLCAHRKSMVNGHLPASAVSRFLHEYYRALGLGEPEPDPDFQTMANWLAERESLTFSPLVSGQAA